MPASPTTVTLTWVSSSFSHPASLCTRGDTTLIPAACGSVEVESVQAKRQLCGGSQAAIERMIHFGRELQSMSEHLRRECGKNSANKKMLKVTSRSKLSATTSSDSQSFDACGSSAGRLQSAGLLRPLEQPSGLPAGRHPERAGLLHPQQCNTW